MASSLIRLKQLNQSEVSGLVSSTLDSSGFMTVAGINTSGFLSITGFNSTIDTSGFATAAAIDTSGFMTITGIDVSGFVPSPITGITVTGSNVITGNVSFTGLGGTLILLNGNELQISGASEVSVGSVTGISIQSGTSLTGLIGITGSSAIGVSRRYDVILEAYTNDIQIANNGVHSFKVNSGLALGTTVNLINGTGTIVSSPDIGECSVNISSDVALNSSLDASGLATQTYVDTKIITGFSNYSFYIDNPQTGLNLKEIFIHKTFICTGYALGLVVSGTAAPAMSGQLYQRNTNNEKILISNFTLEEGLNFKTGSVNTQISGMYRFGLDITGALTSASGFTLSIFGTGI